MEKNNTDNNIILIWLFAIICLLSGPVSIIYVRNDISKGIASRLNDSNKDSGSSQGGINSIDYFLSSGHISPVRYKTQEHQENGHLFRISMGKYIASSIGVDYIPYSSSVYDKKKYILVRKTTNNIEVVDKKVNYVELELMQINTLQKSILGYWYVIGNKYISNRYLAKMYEIIALLKHEYYGTYIQVYSKCGVNCAVARNNIEEYIRSRYNDIEKFVDN